MPDRYLSTDPNAGVEKTYLSTDPNAGEDAGSQPKTPTPFVAAGLTAMKAAPAMVTGLNTAANAAAPLLKAIAARPSANIAMAAPAVAYQLGHGDVGGAALTAGMSGAALAGPAIARGVAMATGPAGGALTSAASAVSKLAEVLGIPLAIASSLYDAYVLSKEKPLHDAPPNIQAGRPWE